MRKNNGKIKVITFYFCVPIIVITVTSGRCKLLLTVYYVRKGKAYFIRMQQSGNVQSCFYKMYNTLCLFKRF